ncbi:MAG: MFS transporter, partial [Pirellulaceae bacterium]|nr:MFS transporter [Pirellulaceae bacterium]
VLGLAYFLVMDLSAFSYLLPAADWQPKGWNPPTEQTVKPGLISRHTVAVNEAMKTPQFWLLWVVLCFNVTAGIGVLGVAKTMLGEIFGPTLPSIVTPGFATTFVLMISVFNMLGRFFWSSLSDYLGRKTTYALYFLLGIPLYLSIPYFAHRESVAPSTFWLVAFYGASMLIFSMYGGGFATIPAYLADLFGTKYVGGIHGRLLTAWSTAGVIGPLVITTLRERSLHQAIGNVAAQVDPSAFADKFGAPLGQLERLVAAKTVTLPRLMEIAPPGTIDPSATLYNTTMVAMAVLLLIALVANTLVQPVDPRHHEQPET